MSHSLDDLSKLSQRERRRLIFLKSATKYRDLGIPIDGDARFMELIEQWIDGRIEMKDVASRAREPVAGKFASEPFPGTEHETQISTYGEVNPSPQSDVERDLGVRADPEATQNDLLRAIDELAEQSFSLSQEPENDDEPRNL
ncbi:hypothetical protein [Rhizobium sp. S163]|uniref:hypothetical protein n=1 Tax=Rhizobium sp. S163 TaxID=3055039 RepID=UPI0025A99D64|nr:hypothetical protein [Rhizobium sp. S163]MDM9646454.1 hypothetical protein [Rhizobium sp. S163]